MPARNSVTSSSLLTSLRLTEMMLIHPDFNGRAAPSRVSRSLNWWEPRSTSSAEGVHRTRQRGWNLLFNLLTFQPFAWLSRTLTMGAPTCE